MSSTCPHNMMNFGLLTAEICWRVSATPVNFNGFRVLPSLIQRRRLPEANQTARCMAVSWLGTLYIHFRDILPADGILPRAKFTFCPSTHHRTSFSGYIFATKASIDNRKKLTKQQYVLQMSPQYGELRPTSGSDRSGILEHPCKFQPVSRLGSFTARHAVVGVSQTCQR